MNTRALLLTATLAAAPAAAQEAPSSPAPAPAVGADKATNLTLVVGAQSVGNVDRLGLARFEKYRDVPDGAVFEYGRFDWTPAGRPWSLSITAVDALQDDQRYHLDWSDPGRFSLRLGYVEVPRYYAADARTLWSGAGTTVLTVPNDVRQPIETAAGAPTSFAPAATLRAVMTQALAGSAPLDLRSERQAATGDFTYDLNDSLSFAVSGRYERRQGTRPLAVGTYTRRQALAGVPGTGAGSFWRETIEARGQELIEPVDQTIPELTLSGTWSRKGHSVSIGWHGSWFRNDATALYFDNPFEASTGRASAILFDPRSDQEPAAPSGNNALRGLYARSAIQLWPENTFQQVFASGSLKLGASSRLSVNASRGSMRQDDAFLPYSENDQVIFSGLAGQPGAVLARDAALPRASLDGEINLTRADVRLTARPAKALALRATYRYYDYDDASPVIDFPGYTSSSDSFFRRSIGQRDAQGNRVLFSRVGGFSRQRLTGGLAYTLGDITLDGEYLRTMHDYDHRQVEATAENAFKGTV
ncbi:MAG TPA: MtrB/PioB family outer membrane beta-barrel protein, partial [Vicinamibacteria bacterium]|nr:MtrB/PioB family outer membrane beta-barrel protein [Vicinamibacteria bacterium]